MSSDCIEATKSYRCESCERHKPIAQTINVALPEKFCFNHEIGIDCVEVKDYSGERCTFLNIACQGATFQRAMSSREGVRHLREHASLHFSNTGAHGQVGPRERRWTVDCAT
eukprot:9107348-Pyramimonas_sp.AAC.1